MKRRSRLEDPDNRIFCSATQDGQERAKGPREATEYTTTTTTMGRGSPSGPSGVALRRRRSGWFALVLATAVMSGRRSDGGGAVAFSPPSSSRGQGRWLVGAQQVSSNGRTQKKRTRAPFSSFLMAQPPPLRQGPGQEDAAVAADEGPVPAPDAFVRRSFVLASECDDANVPPALSILHRSLDQLTGSGSDIRGQFVDHARLGNLIGVAHEVGRAARPGSPPALTPFAAHCIGSALAGMLHDSRRATTTATAAETTTTTTAVTSQSEKGGDDDTSRVVTIAVGIDPRPHSMRLADALARGAETVPRTRVVYTGIATTPACASFALAQNRRSGNGDGAAGGGVDAAVMVTASHLPVDRNGFKIFPRWSRGGSVSRDELNDLGQRAKDAASALFERMTVPPTSGNQALFCSEWVDFMPAYIDYLKGAIVRDARTSRPLDGLSIVLNAGSGSGGFFAKVLSDLGADVSGSVHLEPDPAFPGGIPNPEYKPMIDETISACLAARADLGIMLDTDADRCGFVVPVDRSYAAYEPLHRNRLIALIGVMFSQSHPGCAIVTDSVTSEGLASFLNKLGLQHVRYLKGYANVINKAKELTDAQVGMETSGHCAMKENRYLDDGTYTAAKVVSLLAQRRDLLLNDWIADYQDLPEVSELRMTTFDQSLDTMRSVFDLCAIEIELEVADRARQGGGWELDRQNLEGIRVRVGDGQFFMLRKSLHDPIVSLQIEALSVEHARRNMVDPLIRIFESDGSSVAKSLDLSPLRGYGWT